MAEFGKYTATSLEALADFLDQQGDQTPVEDEARAFWAAAEIVRNTRILTKRELTPLNTQRFGRGDRTLGGFIG